MLQAISIVLLALVATLCVVLLFKISSPRQDRDKETREREQEARMEGMRREFDARLNDRLNEMSRRHEQQLADTRHIYEQQLREVRDSAALQFSQLAGKALERQSERLRAANSEQLDTVISPLQRKIEEFSKSVNDAYMKDNATRQSLSDQIDRLMQLNLTIGEEARSLSSALKGDSKVQGEWGEMVLETLLESAGMKKDINFFTQVTRDTSGLVLRDDNGKAQRPDVLVLLPDDHRMIIDSKVSLSAYVEYCDTADERLRRQAGERHVRSVKNHIDELAAKNYQNRFENAAEHVLMFIPNEGAYFTAIQLDSTLWKYAYDRKVVIVSPTHIFSVMQIVSQLWRQENQSRNVARIAELGGYIYDKVAAMVKEMETVDARLKDASKAYDRAYDHLTKGGTSIVRRAERMRQLGAKTTRSISSAALDNSETGLDNSETGLDNSETGDLNG